MFYKRVREDTVQFQVATFQDMVLNLENDTEIKRRNNTTTK